MNDNINRSRPLPPLKWPTYIFQLLAGILLYLGLLRLAGVDAESLSLLKELDWGSLLGALAMTILLTLFISFRWSLITNGLAGSAVLSRTESFFYVLVGRAIGFVLPKDLSDMAVRTLFLAQRNKVPIHISTNSLILDKLLDLIVSAVFLGPSLLFVFGRTTAQETLGILTLAATGVFFLLFFGSTHIVNFLFWGYNTAIGLMFRLLRRKFNSIKPAGIYSATFAQGYLASVAKQVCIGLRAFFFAQAVGIHLSQLAFLFGASIAQMSYVVAVTPDGLGIFDAAWYGVLRTLQISAEAIGPFLIVQRVFIVLVIGALTILMAGVVLKWKSKGTNKKGQQIRI